MTRNAARILVDQLQIQGVNHVFCVPGESYLAVLDALYDARSIRLVVNPHESGSTFMADAYAKLTGQPGVAFGTRGPGATNASIGVHSAFQDSTPMVLFIGQVGNDFVEREAFQEIDYQLSGSEPQTTNNRMELTAVIKALEALKRPCTVKVVTDSNYVVQGMTTWIYQWVRNKWKNSQKQPVANRDLWETLLHLSSIHDVRWIWIKGHNAHTENERCDSLARLAIKQCRRVTPLHPISADSGG